VQGSSNLRVEKKVGTDALSATDLEELERATIQRVIEETNGDKTLTGQMLGISRATLYRKLKRYNIGQRAKSSDALSAP
jgi:transcriptional regulator of acetoin/glycerol metabolism